MRMNRLGRTGLFVSELCLGTMTFGGTGDIYGKMGNLDQGEADRFVARAMEAGVNFIDTADAYSMGLSEEITGQALRNLSVPRDEVVVATKGYSTMVHGFDAETPIEETVRALDTLVQHGHVRHVGVSNWAAWQIMKGLGIADRLGLPRFASVQSYYSLAGRDLEREIAPLLESEGLGLLPWSPLAAGFLSGKYTRERETIAGDRRSAFAFPPVERERGFRCIDAMAPMAEARGVSVAQIALAWLLHRRVVTSVIIGAMRIEQLDDNLAAATVDLTAAELDALDAASALPGEYPGWMLEIMTIGGRRAAMARRATAR